MTTGSNSKIQESQSKKSASYKRVHRANRPVLVTEQRGAELDQPTEQAEEVQQTENAAELAENTTTETVTRKRKPGFFLNIGKTESRSDQPAADPKAVRMARAMRGKTVDAPAEAVQEKKPAASTPKASSVPARPRSGFKMKYIWGMMAYLLIADFLGVWIEDWMQANHLDAHLFTWGPFVGNRSTLIFLALLVIILVVMARFDLIPRSFGAMMSGSSSANTSRTGAGKGTASKNSTSKAPTFETKAAQPTLKQGVQGEDDELYREYRENQRYFQKRDRKR